MALDNTVLIFSTVIALVALFLTLWQNFLTRKAVQSQVLLSLKENAKEIRVFGGMDRIYLLETYTDYASYVKSVSEEDQKLIYDTVDFLNFVSHLVEDGFLPRQTAWNYYFHSYETCSSRLLPWWLEGIRKEQHQGFTSFEKMCKRVGKISKEDIRKHEARQQRKSISVNHRLR
jgi:hypothetical protein